MRSFSLFDGSTAVATINSNISSDVIPISVANKSGVGSGVNVITIALLGTQDANASTTKTSSALIIHSFSKAIN
jgi:hypothetical protein